MKTHIITTLVLLASSAAVHAQGVALEFSSRSIDLPKLSLSGAAQQALKDQLPDLTPRISRPMSGAEGSTSYYSNMPVKAPDEKVDAKLTIKHPDSSVDYKLRVATPKVESSK